MISEVFLVSVLVFLGGLIKGFAGFGYAVAGVGMLSLFFSPEEAVILMIVPLMAGNITLINEIDPGRLKHCLSDFRVLMASMVLGTLIGMFFVGKIPANIFSKSIGIFLILYVLVRSDVLEVHIEKVRENCFRKNNVFQSISGFLGGFIFGSMSIGALIVSYLDSVDLEREVFVGLLSFALFIISGLRIVLSWYFGYYSGNDLLSFSLLASIPGVIGVIAGSKVGSASSEKRHEMFVLALFVLIGLKLLLG